MEETIQSMELAQNYKTVKENVTKALKEKTWRYTDVLNVKVM